jgi:hypothetical protein
MDMMNLTVVVIVGVEMGLVWWHEGGVRVCSPPAILRLLHLICDVILRIYLFILVGINAKLYLFVYTCFCLQEGDGCSSACSLLYDVTQFCYSGKAGVCL